MKDFSIWPNRWQPWRSRWYLEAVLFLFMPLSANVVLRKLNLLYFDDIKSSPCSKFLSIGTDFLNNYRVCVYVLECMLCVCVCIRVCVCSYSCMMGKKQGQFNLSATSTPSPFLRHEPLAFGDAQAAHPLPRLLHVGAGRSKRSFESCIRERDSTPSCSALLLQGTSCDEARDAFRARTF